MYNKSYYEQNKEKILASRKTPEFRERLKQWRKERTEQDPSFRDRRREEAKRSDRKRRRRNRELLNKIKLHYGCMNPGCCWTGDLHPACLDYHHINGEDKKFGAAQCHRPTALLINEINKCTVVCANCHRMITWGKLDGSQIRKCRISSTGDILDD